MDILLNILLGLLPLLVLPAMGFFCGAHAALKTIHTVVGIIAGLFALALGPAAPVLIPFLLFILPPYYLGVFLGRKFQKAVPAMDANEFQYELLRQQVEQPRQHPRYEP